MIEIDNITDLEKVLKNDPRIIILNFFADYCVSCYPLKKKLADLESQYSNYILVININVRLADPIQDKYHINQLPTVLFFKNRKYFQNFRLVGYEVNNILKVIRAIGLSNYINPYNQFYDKPYKSIQNMLENTLKKSNKIIILNFFANYCTSCNILTKQLESIEYEYSKLVTIININVQLEHKLSEKYKIDQLPTVMFFQYERNFQKYRLVGPTIGTILNVINIIKTKYNPILNDLRTIKPPRN